MCIAIVCFPSSDVIDFEQVSEQGGLELPSSNQAVFLYNQR